MSLFWVLKSGVMNGSKNEKRKKEIKGEKESKTRERKEPLWRVQPDPEWGKCQCFVHGENCKLGILAFIAFLPLAM